MKKMRFFLMSAVTCFAIFATMSLTSCNKEDVTYAQEDEAVLFMEVDGKDLQIPCPLCGVIVPPQSYHVHVYEAMCCPLGPTICSHYDRRHWHIFQNHTGASTGGTWLELTTHLGGTIPTEGAYSGTINFHN